MFEQKIYLHPRFHRGPVSSLIFGGFLEHLGRAVYGGVFEPTSKHADKDGFRLDVLEALESLKMTIMRWPGVILSLITTGRMVLVQRSIVPP